MVYINCVLLRAGIIYTTTAPENRLMANIIGSPRKSRIPLGALVVYTAAARMSYSLVPDEVATPVDVAPSCRHPNVQFQGVLFTLLLRWNCHFDELLEIIVSPVYVLRATSLNYEFEHLAEICVRGREIEYELL